MATLTGMNQFNCLLPKHLAQAALHDIVVAVLDTYPGMINRGTVLFTHLDGVYTPSSEVTSTFETETFSSPNSPSRKRRTPYELRTHWASYGVEDEIMEVMGANESQDGVDITTDTSTEQEVLAESADGAIDASTKRKDPSQAESASDSEAAINSERIDDGVSQDKDTTKKGEAREVITTESDRKARNETLSEMRQAKLTKKQVPSSYVAMPRVGSNVTSALLVGHSFFASNQSEKQADGSDLESGEGGLGNAVPDSIMAISNVKVNSLHCSVEIEVSPRGLFLFYHNISPVVVHSIADIIHSSTQSAISCQALQQALTLHSLGLLHLVQQDGHNLLRHQIKNTILGYRNIKKR